MKFTLFAWLLAIAATVNICASDGLKAGFQSDGRGKLIVSCQGGSADAGKNIEINAPVSKKLRMVYLDKRCKSKYGENSRASMFTLKTDTAAYVTVENLM